MKPKSKIITLQEYGQRFNIWDCVSQSVDGHPAPFPEQLAKDHIYSWSNECDLVYDPFCGSGTVPKKCIEMDRNYIGSEISEKYCKIIEKRIKYAELNKMDKLF